MATRVHAHPCLRSLCAALGVLCIALGAQAARLAVAPSEADPIAAPWAAGYDYWLRSHLSAAGLSPIWRGPALSAQEVFAGAESWGASHVLLPRLREHADGVEVQLLLYAPGGETPLAASRSSAPAGDPGRAIAASFDALLQQLGAAGAATTPPLLDDLACSSRALEAHARGHLFDAWHAVKGKLSPSAMQLRESLVAEARHGEAAPTERARVLAAVGDPGAAWRLIGTDARNVLDTATPDPALLVAVGEVALARNNARDARRYLDRAAEAASDTSLAASAQLGLARVLELQGDTAATRKALERAAQLAPDDPEPFEWLARLEEQQPERAAAHLLAAAQRAAQRLDANRARLELERARALDPRRTPETQLAVAELDTREGRPAEALAAYREAQAAGADGVDLQLGMGLAERAVGDTAGAQKSFERALALDAAQPQALSALGGLYTESGRAAQALPLLERAHDLAPDDAGVRRSYAQTLQALGKPQAAAEILVPDAHSAPPVDLQLAASLHLALGDYDGARALLARAVQLDPADGTLRGKLATVLEHQGNESGAAAQRDIAARFDPAQANPAGESTEPGALSWQRQAVTLEQFVSTFAVQVPDAQERRIARLGLRQGWGWRSLLVRLSRPRTPDVRRIERALDQALAARFQRGAAPTRDSDVIETQIDQLYAFDRDASLDAHAIATVNQVLGVDGVFLSKLALVSADSEAGSCAVGSIRLESRLLLGSQAEVASILANSDCLEGGLESYGTWNYPAFGAYAVGVLLLLLPAIRGWGTLVVTIRLPERTKGFLSIHITTKPDQVQRERVDKQTGRGKVRASRRLDFLRRFERHMAGRETVFRWIPARKGNYTVTVGGPLLDAQGGEIIGHFLEERPVRVRRGQTQKLEFDFRPKECAVEVFISDGGQPAAGGRAAVWGDRDSIRYARDGTAYLYLGLGSYTIAIGSKDSAAALPLEVKSLASAIPLDVDFGSDYGVIFRGCQEAVDPYLQGDLASAAAALEASGDARAAHHIRGILLERAGRTEEAAAQFEAAELFEDAARLRATGSDFQGSAALFEQVGDHERAADAYRTAGRFSDAARCYENFYDFQSALECWREAGDTERELQILEKMGEYIEASSVAVQLQDFDRAITNLQQIDHRHASYSNACRMIAEILCERGDYERAAAKYEAAIQSVGAENASVELLEGFAGALERAGRLREALSAYEAVGRRDVQRDDIAARVEQLRGQIGETAAGGGATQRRATPVESRYELLAELGRGGMGVVYKARDKRLGRIVALKQLPENLREHPRAVELFEREARAAAALNHMNIVTLFDAGEENGTYFISMELLEGRPLNEIVEQHQRLSVRDAARLGVQITTGLQYAHDQRIVHRDIKTANLFFTRDRVVKIMDFGIAKSLEEVRRSTTVVGGTPFYMAPEQAAGQSVDHRADLYAFGVTLFQLVSGRLPFPDGDVTYRHCHEAPPDPREMDLEIPEALSRLILRLLAKQPDERPDSAAEVGAALRAAVAPAGA
jgi:tetratricopeptide (TPR) repeat protein